MKRFTSLFWIARKNNFTLLYCEHQKIWFIFDWKTFTENYFHYQFDYVIDFYDGKCKVIDWSNNII